MPDYTCTFERIGRKHDVDPLVTAATDANDLADKVLQYARPYLLSRDVEVFINLDDWCGLIFCGLNSGGRFTIREGEDDQAPADRSPDDDQLDEHQADDEPGEQHDDGDEDQADDEPGEQHDDGDEDQADDEPAPRRVIDVHLPPMPAEVFA